MVDTLVVGIVPVKDLFAWLGVGRPFHGLPDLVDGISDSGESNEKWVREWNMSIKYYLKKC